MTSYHVITVFFSFQQFVTQSARIAYGSYFVTTYKRGRCTWSKISMKRDKKGIKKRKKELIELKRKGEKEQEKERKREKYN